MGEEVEGACIIVNQTWDTLQLFSWNYEHGVFFKDSISHHVSIWPFQFELRLRGTILLELKLGAIFSLYWRWRDSDESLDVLEHAVVILSPLRHPKFIDQVLAEIINAFHCLLFKFFISNVQSVSQCLCSRGLERHRVSLLFKRFSNFSLVAPILRWQARSMLVAKSVARLL